MAQIVPTITAVNPHIFRTQLESRESFAQRLHIDLADDDFAPNELIPITQIYWTDGKTIDMHMMINDPGRYLDEYISLKPNLLIVHAEAKDGELDKVGLFEKLKQAGIKVGLCLLADSTVDDHKEMIKMVDHVLIFAGNLGYQGGQADLSCLNKVAEIKALNPDAEIAWDGGVKAENAKRFTEAGVDVLNVGGFIAKSASPQEAYAILEQIAVGSG